MGFIISRLYRRERIKVLVLKDLEINVLKGINHKEIYKYSNRYIEYSKIDKEGIMYDIIQMNNQRNSEYFWDCIENMNGVVYCTRAQQNTEIDIERLTNIKQANKQAHILIIGEITDTKPIEQILHCNKYKIVQLEEINKGIEWLLKEISE
ncbi:hypothetical protein NEOKW01_1280 [Nematocida sp. AWRm80]|nr:hypothetical protein NEOKW01_1280 [Nematocida sp. AWRm80]